ncbi:MAG: hypothetical protein ACYTFF_20885 [Planctomycetota bacterium]|jgi:hypothetical protein
MSPDDPGEKLPHGPGDGSPDRRMENLLDQLQVQTRRVRDTWQAGEATRLRILAGQLASLAEGAGHSVISRSAGELEAVLLAEEAEASAMCEKIEALIQQCKQAADSD